MTKVLPFLNDPGIHRTFVDNEDGTATIVEKQNCDDILDRNKSLYTASDGYNAARDMRRVASIPLLLVYEWLEKEGWNAFDPKHADKLKQKLNSSEYLYLRTAPGRL